MIDDWEQPRHRMRVHQARGPAAEEVRGGFDEKYGPPVRVEDVIAVRVTKRLLEGYLAEYHVEVLTGTGNVLPVPSKGTWLELIDGR